MLYNYKNTKAEIKILKRDLEILENDYRGTGAISYEERSSPTNAFSSSVENEVIRKDEMIQKLKNIIRLKEIEIENIDDALATLTLAENKLVELKYFKKIPNKKIAIELNVVEQTSCKYKDKIIKKLIDLIFFQ